MVSIKEEGDQSPSTTPEKPAAGSFENFSLNPKLVTKLQKRGITHLFPVQISTFKPIYKGRDVCVQARTGSGKTLSFVLPVLNRLLKNKTPEERERGRAPKVICLAPTRELAVQIYDDFVSMVDGNEMNVDKFYGGQPYIPQETAIRRGMDILVGTPGRILDLCEKGKLHLGSVKHVILDEADRMLEIGFKVHMDKIIEFCTTNNKPQMMLFSATMPQWVSEVSATHMTNPKTVSLVSKNSNQTSTTVNHLAVRCVWQSRNDIIGDLVQQYSGRHGRAIVFTQTKVQADELAVSPSINQDCQVLHGDIPQATREKRLQGFRDGKFQCLVATDVAARGLDIPQIDLVIQCEPPKDVDSYIHRSGRTGRAGRTGTCICLYNAKQEYSLKEVERHAGIKFTRVTPPQPKQIIKAAAKDAVRCLDDVPSKVLPAFKSYAKELLETRPAEDIVAAALSYISGVTEIKTRSTLSSMEGYTAYQMSNTFEVRSPYFFWNALEQGLGETFRADVKFMKLTKDKTGCVIDVPCKYDEFIEDTWHDTKTVQLFKMTEIPELEDFRGRFGGGAGGNSGGYNRNGGGNGGYNNRNGGGGWSKGGRGGTGGGGRGNSSGFKRKQDFGNGNGFKRTKQF